MKIDLAELESQKILYEDEIKELESKIYELAGITFNIQSPKQLGEVLFERLMLPVIKKSKSGAYTTDIEVLNRLVDEHEIINYIIRYRTVVKLYQTYLVGLEQQVHSDGKVHTIFQQALTTTGRLSSIEPNVQNIPIRTFEGRKIRKLFVPANDNLLFSSDYSQIELRVLAHMASSPALIEAFKNNLDVHSETAKKIFATNEVTSDLRRKAKAVNFGIIYGISAYGLSNDVEISMKEAKEFIDKYFELYPEIKTFMDSTIEFASEAGYVLTLSNRRRYIPSLKSPVYMQREAAKRIAMNAPIQGSAADIMKYAMVDVYDAMKELNLKSKMIAQVHDELVFDLLVLRGKIRLSGQRGSKLGAVFVGVNDLLDQLALVLGSCKPVLEGVVGKQRYQLLRSRMRQMHAALSGASSCSASSV
jgi:DNA polymerase-1